MQSALSLNSQNSYPPEEKSEDELLLTNGGFFAQFNYIFKMLKQSVDQTVFVAGLINIESSDPFPDPMSLLWGALVACLICLAEAGFHSLMDTLKEPRPQMSDAVLYRAPSSDYAHYKYRLSLSGHVLNDVLDGAGFISVVHGGFSYYFGHNISLPENICVKTLGMVIGVGTTVDETRNFIKMLQHHDLWDSPANKKKRSKASESTPLLQAVVTSAL